MKYSGYNINVLLIQNRDHRVIQENMALLLGIITPIVSSILTGMPVAFPMAIIMAFELGTYGLPGLLIQIIFIPTLIYALKSFTKISLEVGK